MTARAAITAAAVGLLVLLLARVEPGDDDERERDDAGV